MFNIQVPTYYNNVIGNLCLAFYLLIIMVNIPIIFEIIIFYIFYTLYLYLNYTDSLHSLYKLIKTIR